LTAARSVVRNVVLCEDAMVADRKAAYSADCVKPAICVPSMKTLTSYAFSCHADHIYGLS